MGRRVGRIMTRLVTPQGALVLRADAPRDQWLSARRRGITATDIVKIVGLSPYGNAIDVVLDKRLPSDDTAPSEAAQWGLLLEDQVAREWARRNDCRIRRVGLLARYLQPHHLASCDRRVTNERAALEVKTRTAWAADEWAHGVPERVAVQSQWQLHVTGFDRVHVAALVGGQQLHSATVERDEVLIDYLVSEADRVWAAVEAGQMPEVPPWQLTAESLRRAWPDREGAVELDPERIAAALPHIDAYRAQSAIERDAKAAKDIAKLALVQLLDGASEALIGGETVYSYRTSTDTTTIPAENARRLLADHPDLVEYAVTKPGRASFSLAKSKEA